MSQKKIYYVSYSENDVTKYINLLNTSEKKIKIKEFLAGEYPERIIDDRTSNSFRKQVERKRQQPKRKQQQLNIEDMNDVNKRPKNNVENNEENYMQCQTPVNFNISNNNYNEKNVNYDEEIISNNDEMTIIECNEYHLTLNEVFQSENPSNITIFKNDSDGVQEVKEKIVEINRQIVDKINIIKKQDHDKKQDL
jgi:hypothetical protein